MPKADWPEWERVLSAAAHLHRLLPNAALVGGTVAAVFAQHRFSRDAGRQERLDLTTDASTWLATLNELPQVEFVPVNNEIAMHSATLPGNFHKDRADRIIAATARLASATLISADAEIQAYRHVKTIW